MPLISALRRQRQIDANEFKANLAYTAISRPVKAMQWNYVFKNQYKQTTC